MRGSVAASRHHIQMRGYAAEGSRHSGVSRDVRHIDGKVANEGLW